MRPLAVAAVLVVAFVLRWATLTSLSGDDHYTLWIANAFLQGDRPFRDFVDLGIPLNWAMSTLAQAIAGHRVVGEVALGTSLVAVAFAVAFQLAWRASGSVVAALGFTALALLVVTQRELYSAQKIFLYPLAVWLCWRYIDRQTLGRAAALALGVAFAFGYRHDHGAYVGVGAAAAILAAHWDGGPRRVIAGWFRFGVALLLMVSPYLVLVQVNEGLIPYFQERMRLARDVDVSSRRAVSFTVDTAAPDHWFGVEPRPARAFVEWKPEVTPSLRAGLESQYSLTGGRDPKKGLYEYWLADVSTANLAALVSDSRMADRRGISASYREDAAGERILSEVVATDRSAPDAPPAARARVEIQWKDSVTEEERGSLERSYGLLDNRSRWEYALTDVTTDNIRAIVEDPRVYDTGLLDRETFRPMEESWMVRLQRAVPLFRLSVAPRYWHAENAGVALQFMMMALPWLLLAMLAADRIRGRRGGRMPLAPEKTFAAAVMMAVAYAALLRRAGYFGDHVAVAVILAACALGHVLGGVPAPQRTWSRLVTRGIAAVTLVVGAFATMTYASPMTIAPLASTGERGIWQQSIRLWQTYSTSPAIDAYAPPGSTGDRGLIRYLYECTRPDDRLWLLTDQFALPYYAERRVVGHIYWKGGLLANPAFERKTIEQVDKAQVPIIIGHGGTEPLASLASYPLVRDYVARRYTGHYAVPGETLGQDLVFWVLTDSRRTPTGTYELLGLPCFK